MTSKGQHKESQEEESTGQVSQYMGQPSIETVSNSKNSHILMKIRLNYNKEVKKGSKTGQLNDSKPIELEVLSPTRP